MSYPVPILVMAFNRPAPAAGLLEVLKQLRPVRLYLAFDGPRLNSPGEQEHCEAVRDLFRDGIDWPCQVAWLLRTHNLGCRLAVSSAIDWFFESESEGVILEDDIHPVPSFFGYCAELLERYRDDERIGTIAANNHQSEPPPMAPVIIFRFTVIVGAGPLGGELGALIIRLKSYGRSFWREVCCASSEGANLNGAGSF